MSLAILKNTFVIIANAPVHRQILTKESQHFTVSGEKEELWESTEHWHSLKKIQPVFCTQWVGQELIWHLLSWSVRGAGENAGWEDGD